MATQVDYPIVGSYNNQRITNIDAERSVNVFEYIDAKGKKPKCLIFTSGILDSAIAFTGAVGGARAEFVFVNFHFVVFGSSVYRIDNSNIAVLIGSLSNTVGYVGIDANQATNPQVIFVDGVRGFIYDTVMATFTQITDTNFPARPIDVCFLDGFFVVANGLTNHFQLCLINQGLVWGGQTPFTITATNLIQDTMTISSTDNFQTGVPITFSGGGIVAPLNTTDTFYAIRFDATNIRVATSFANAMANIFVDLVAPEVGDVTVSGQLQLGSITSHPGTIVACRTLHRRLFLFSQNFTEPWENAGIGSNLPFRPNRSLLMEVGTPAIGSISVGFDKMFFLSQDKDGLGSVIGVSGTQSVPVSNRALDYALAQYASDTALLVPGVSTGVTDARGVMVKENGIIFYRLNFTAANHTYVYNVTLSDPSSEEGKLWHEEEILNGNRHPAQTHGYFNGKNYFGDYQNPVLYVVDNSITTNNGEAIRRMRIGQAVVPGGYQRTRVDRFHLDLQQGQPTLDDFSEVDIDLYTEDSFTLLTEASVDIILDNTDFNQITNANPIVYLSFSKDGGQSYGYKQIGLMGKIGERSYRTVWRKLGTVPRGQAVVPKIEFFGKGPFIILGAAWVSEVMPE